MTQKINSQKGIAQFLVIAVMAFLALGIPAATKLVQENQENRSKATSNNTLTNHDFNNDSTIDEKDVQIVTKYIVSDNPNNPYDTNKDSKVDMKDIMLVIKTINNKEYKTEYDFNNDNTLDEKDCQIVTKYIVSDNPDNPYDINKDGQVDIMDTVKLIDIINSKNEPVKKSTPVPSPISTTNTEVSFHHNFAPKDYSIRKIGSVLINDIVIKTGGKKIDTATIVYCYTDLLKPDFNSISGEQIASVVSNKEIGNNCAELKVTFNDKQLNDPFPMYQDLTGYIISYKVTVVKYGKGTLQIDCAKSSLLDINGEKIVINDPNCGYNNGSDFTLTNLETISPTPTSTPTPPTVEASRITKIGKYIDLSLYPDELSSISDKNLNLWLDRLNLAYEDYFELTGWKPHDGKEVTIRSVECGDKCPGWAWADSSPVISWAKQWWLKTELEKIDNNDDWSFGILHEISHKFDNYDSWGGFDNEMMANFKMAYLIEKENGKVSPGYSGKYYVGSQIINYYKLADNGYEYAINQNTYTGDFLTYILLRIKDQIGGWDVYKQVFRNLGGKKLDSNNIKINAFLDEMSIVSKKDVRKMFNQEEKAIMELKFGKVFPTEIDGKCNTSLNKCLSGTFKDLPNSTTLLVWQCLGSNGGKSVKCTVKQNITPNSRPTLVLTRPLQLPATSIRTSPLGLSLKVGQKRNLTYILTPSNSTDTVKWSTSGTGQVRIQKINLKCANPVTTESITKCMDSPGSNHIQITALKPGTVKINLTTSSAKTTTATVVVKK